MYIYHMGAGRSVIEKVNEYLNHAVDCEERSISKSKHSITCDPEDREWWTAKAKESMANAEWWLDKAMHIEANYSELGSYCIR